MQISDGERRGNNIFHSFEEFSIAEGLETVFANATDIENIFIRVTGDKISNLNGLLSTQGDANFFLINPNGISFRKNAQLNVGGSFLASTAESIQFENSVEFSAINPNEPLLDLTGFPLGLGFSSNPGSITVNALGHQIVSGNNFSPVDLGNTESGLSVTPAKTLALIGGEINFSGGIVTAEGGKIEISSLESGSVGLQEIENKLTFDYNDAVGYQDITFADQALLNTSGEGKAEISLTGKNVLLSDGSHILNQNKCNSSGGLLNITASEKITLSGKSPYSEISSAIRSDVLETGKIQGAKINISAQQLKLLDQGQIQAGNFSKTVDSLGGSISVNVFDLVNLNGGFISSSAFSKGDAGNIEVSTSQLQIINIASITSSTVGGGNGGNIDISTDLIELIGSRSDARSTISSSSLGSGNAGSLKISTEQLRVEEGASFSSSSFGYGNAGNISIDASESITLNGENSKFQSNNKPQSSTIRTSVQTIDSKGQKIFRLPDVPTGNAGNLTIKTPQFNILQSGVVSAENQGAGKAGTISIKAEKINLDDTASISAAAASGHDGEININGDRL